MKHTNIGKFYNHDPRHYRFERRCDGFEPDANDGDRFVFGAAVAIATGLVFWMIVAHFAAWWLA